MAQPPDHNWVRDASTLAQLANALRGAPWVALDSESNSMFVYRERVCLLQLNVGGELWLIDPFALAGDGPQPEQGAEALAPLAAALADPKLRVWVHGGEYDVACLKRDFDLTLTNLFDTQQAASFLGWSRTGYAAAVEEVCGVVLTKEHTQYDWGQRPIDASALCYALDDVVHLPEVGAELARRIADADLSEELELANHAVTRAATHANRFDPSRMWKLKGIKEVRPNRLGLLTALYAWRDEKGRELNYPPGRLIANQPLVHLAVRAPKDRAALRRARLRASFASSHGDELLAVITEALREPPSVPEQPARPRPPAGQAARAKAIKKWRRKEAERRELPPYVVLPPRALDWIVSQGCDDLDACPELGPKRAARYGATLRELCAR